MNKHHLISATFVLLTATEASSDTQLYGDILIRYEDEGNHISLPPRERMRLIAHAGIKTQWTENWLTHFRLGTGLKNKQNVPGITIHRFSEQPQPDSDIFLERAFIQGKGENWKVEIGKVPWNNFQVTDIFWDGDLNPWGMNFNYEVSAQSTLYLSYYQPLDGNSDTIGDMSLIGFQWREKMGNWQLGITPWFVDYQGESNAQYATKDTQYDNQFLLLSAYAKYGMFKVGLDYGHSLDDFDYVANGKYSDQKESVALEFAHGGLKSSGDWLIQFRLLKVERFGVVTEFAQNAVSPFATSNFKGVDLRIRRKMSPEWWLGMRFSDIQRIIEPLEEGYRFRIEGQYKF
ncbi:putative porin [Paraneptunicella aestuarii]|uniref:putative porin n=1 Tax=Paraneptunicella aestuarii TaxID=2831148 RepID=UPI001E3011DF|nr:putative porin [Paraneptunicella aestuarii]UAA40488.1 putative porin [Paraneptunicella aestuarii]